MFRGHNDDFRMRVSSVVLLFQAKITPRQVLNYNSYELFVAGGPTVLVITAAFASKRKTKFKKRIIL
jgi:hypothetical protein